jgi:hypothetical protein
MEMEIEKIYMVCGVAHLYLSSKEVKERIINWRDEEFGDCNNGKEVTRKLEWWLKEGKGIFRFTMSTWEKGDQYCPSKTEVTLQKVKLCEGGTFESPRPLPKEWVKSSSD